MPTQMSTQETGPRKTRKIYRKRRKDKEQMKRPDFPDFAELERKRSNLCKLASLIAEKTHNWNIKIFMENFPKIDCNSPDFDQMYTLFKYGVKLSLDLEKSLLNIDGINDLLLRTNIKV